MSGAILLSAGGTGGHLFPAQALAQELIGRGWTIYLATDGRAERFAGKFPAEDIFVIPSATFGSKNPVALLKTLWTIWKGVREAGRVIAKINPKVVVGFGGYPTLPPVYAASRRGVPTIVHEQNAVMGRANKALARLASAVAGGFLKASGQYGAKIFETGNPVRQAVLDVVGTNYQTPAAGGKIRLLVFGGSQGARYFSDTVPEAIALLPDDMRSRIELVQQARPEDEQRVSDRYRELDVKAEVAPFFSDLPERMARAQLVVSRAGASTVLELSIIGRPAILVPLPHALDDDQGHNAGILVEAGGAIMRRQQDGFDAEALAQELSDLLQAPEQLSAMAAAAKSVGKPGAVHLLADLVEAIASGQSVEQFKLGAGP